MKCFCCRQPNTAFFCHLCIGKGTFSTGGDVTYEDFIQKVERTRATSSDFLQRINYEQTRIASKPHGSRVQLRTLAKKVEYRLSVVQAKRDTLGRLNEESKTLGNRIGERQLAIHKYRKYLQDVQAKKKKVTEVVTGLEQLLKTECRLHLEALIGPNMFHLDILDPPGDTCWICELPFIDRVSSPSSPSTLEKGPEPTIENHASLLYLVILCRCLAQLSDCPLPASTRRIFSLPRGFHLREQSVERDQLRVIYQLLVRCFVLLHSRWLLPSGDEPQLIWNLLREMLLVVKRDKLDKRFLDRIHTCPVSSVSELPGILDIWQVDEAKDISSPREHWNLTLSQSSSLSEGWEEICSEQLPDASTLTGDGSVSQINPATVQSTTTISRVFGSIWPLT